MESAGKRHKTKHGRERDDLSNAVAIEGIVDAVAINSNDSLNEATSSMSTIVKRKTKKKIVDDELGEKRLLRFRSYAPQGTKERISRALSQRMFLIDSKIHNEIKRSYKVLGSTGNVYDVDIESIPKCSCPDFLKGNLCKHVIFVLCRVLNQERSSRVIYQNALLTIELQEIFALSDSKGVSRTVQASESVQKAAAAATGGAVTESEETSIQPDRKPEGECSICFESMAAATEQTSSCKTCKNFLHSECIDKWLRSAASSKACPYCRSPWHQGSSSSHSRSEGDEGYVNLASVAGISSARPYYPRTWNQWWE
jgi:hypothetical protein